MPTSPDCRDLSMCITELDVGGAERAFVRVARGLQELGWNVRAISLRDAGPLAGDLTASEIPVTALNCGGMADLRCLWRLTGELRRHRPNILLSFLHQANLYGRLAAAAAGVPISVSGIRVADRRRSVVLPDRWTHKLVSHYVAVSQAVGQTHAQLCRIPPERMTAIPNGIDVAADRPMIEFQQRPESVLLFVGRLTQQKDPGCLLTAVQLLSSDVKRRVSVRIVGEGELRPELQRGIQELAKSDPELAGRIQLAGRSDDVTRVMNEATLLVLPSRWEGLPNVVLEAMVSGLPVVASDVDGVRELIQHENTGWLFPSGNPQALADQLSAALQSAEARKSVSTNAQQSLLKTLRGNPRSRNTTAC
ncbi:MAG: glycosyltransferase [Planctomycetaceae bacterium]